MNKDLFGKALQDYYNNNYTADLITSTNISGEDELPLPYLFRSYSEMPKLEQKALQLAKGNVLDVGCGSGSHSLSFKKKVSTSKQLISLKVLLLLLKIEACNMLSTKTYSKKQKRLTPFFY